MIIVEEKSVETSEETQTSINTNSTTHAQQNVTASAAAEVRDGPKYLKKKNQTC